MTSNSPIIRFFILTSEFNQILYFDNLFKKETSYPFPVIYGITKVVM